MGTERHEARRIDNQLRGRSGRQGDPGESKFFLSLEDDLVKTCGGDPFSKVRKQCKDLHDDAPIEYELIADTIIQVQTKIEEQYFEARKYLLQYDNIINEQRTAIYQLRREILGEADNLPLIHQMIEDYCGFIVEKLESDPRAKTKEEWFWEEINKIFQTSLNTCFVLQSKECGQHENAFQYIRAIAKTLFIQKFSKYDEGQVRVIVRDILLSILDHYWREHLSSLDQLKEGVSLRSYAQKDPLVEFKHDAYQAYENMKSSVKRTVTENIFHIEL